MEAVRVHGVTVYGVFQQGQGWIANVWIEDFEDWLRKDSGAKIDVY